MINQKWMGKSIIKFGIILFSVMVYFFDNGHKKNKKTKQEFDSMLQETKYLSQRFKQKTKEIGGIIELNRPYFS